MTAMEESQIARHAVDRLPQIFRDRLGLELKVITNNAPSAYNVSGHNRSDLEFELFSNPPVALCVEIKARLLRSHIQSFIESTSRFIEQDPRAIPLLVVPRLNERSKRQLRVANLNHADLLGTVYIRSADLIIDIDGRDNYPHLPSYRSSKVNPFSDKASFVLRVLFESPKRAWRVTEITRKVDLTKGWVSVVSRELLERGYIADLRDGFRLLDIESALHDWSQYYQWNRNRIESYSAPFDYVELLAKLQRSKEVRTGCALTLLSGADQIAPHVQHGQAHLYVHPLRTQLASSLREQLFLEPVSAGGNVHLVQPFYKRSAFFGVRTVNNLPVIAPVQLYLDLVSSPLRGHESASVLLENVLSKAASHD